MWLGRDAYLIEQAVHQRIRVCGCTAHAVSLGLRDEWAMVRRHPGTTSVAGAVLHGGKY
jgi:hypothetical protein